MNNGRPTAVIHWSIGAMKLTAVAALLRAPLVHELADRRAPPDRKHSEQRPASRSRIFSGRRLDLDRELAVWPRRIMGMNSGVVFSDWAVPSTIGEFGVCAGGRKLIGLTNLHDRRRLRIGDLV